jgi:CHASE3 domain sensor protein
MKLSTQILLAICLVLLLSVAESYANYLLSLKVERNTQFLSKSEAIIRNSNRIHKAIIEMQSGFRGYLLTNDSAFLEPYYKGLKDAPGLINEQKQFIKQNKSQSSLLDSIHNLHLAWIDYANSLIQAKRKLSAESQSTYTKLFENKLKNFSF